MNNAIKNIRISDLISIRESCYNENIALAKEMLARKDKNLPVIAEMVGVNFERLMQFLGVNSP